MRKNSDSSEFIAELEIQKSNLLLEAQMLAATGDPESAIDRYARAAPMEKRIANFYTVQHDPIEAARHRFSAAVCYAKSGSLRDALILFDALGRASDTPGDLKGNAILLAGRLRQQQRDTLQSYGHPLRAVA